VQLGIEWNFASQFSLQMATIPARSTDETRSPPIVVSLTFTHIRTFCISP
jgi:hypothetical protein